MQHFHGFISSRVNTDTCPLAPKSKLQFKTLMQQTVTVLSVADTNWSGHFPLLKASRISTQAVSDSNATWFCQWQAQIRTLAPFKGFKSTQAVSDSNATWFCQWQAQIRTLAPFKVFKSTQAVSDSNATWFCQWQTQTDPDTCPF